MNDIQIIENKNHLGLKWIRFRPNNSYFNFSDERIKFILEHQDVACRWLKLLFDSKLLSYYKLQDDEIRKPTLEELLSLKKIIEFANAKYNKKTKKITFL